MNWLFSQKECDFRVPKAEVTGANGKLLIYFQYFIEMP